MNEREGPQGALQSGEPVVRFGEFRFLPESGELFRRGQRVAVGPKPTAVLALLLERAGRLVERERFYERVWPDAVVEFDQGLNACIRQIRRAIGDDARAPRFIETIPRRGYRFVHAVECGERAWTPRRSRRPGVALRAVLGLVVIAGLVGGAWLMDPAPSSSVLAHVDFDVASDRSELVLLGQDMERRVRARLAPVERQASGGESYYVTGTLSEQEDGALLRALLVRARDGEIVWSGSFNPLCREALSDPKRFVGDYLARVIARS